MRRQNKIIRDAVHGEIPLTLEEIALIDSHAVQRLRGIKQLGMASLVFPSAVHTRFDHSLGTCLVTKKLLAALQLAGHSLSARDYQTACFAALLHDVTHVPFGHTFEDERRLFPRHDEDTSRLEFFLGSEPIAAVLEEHEQTQSVFGVLSKNGHAPAFLKDLVVGTFCADLLDYLRRDAFFCGLPLAYDERLFAYVELSGGRFAIRLHKNGNLRRDAVSELVNLLQMRYVLTERVYYHHAKLVAGAMISRAVELAIQANALTQRDLYRFRDDSLLAHLDHLGDAGVEGLSPLVAAIESRQLYKQIYLLTMEGYGQAGLTSTERDELAAVFHHDPAARARAEADIAERLGVPAAHVILYCPAPKMQLKEADVPVELPGGQVAPLSCLDHPDINALATKHQGLWRLFVCVRRELEPRAAEAAAHCEAVIGWPNQLERDRKAQWFRPR